MAQQDYILEQFYKSIADRPKDKNNEVNTFFVRDIYYYDRDEVARQQRIAERSETSAPLTYEQHRAAVETAVTLLRVATPHDVALKILSHRFFAQYRTRLFEGEGNFNADYSYLLLKVSTLFDASNTKVIRSNIATKLREFKTPTLVSINHIAGVVETVRVPSDKFTLNEWAQRYSAGAPESTTYAVAGLKVGS